MSVTDFPGYYVELPVVVDDQQLADQAVEQVQATWPDWMPSDGNLEVILIETLAPFAAVAAQNLAQMSQQAFIALGTKLYGIPYQAGLVAQATVTLTFQDANGPYTAFAGSEFELQGYAFQLADDAICPVGQTQVFEVPVIANDIGTAYNSLTSAGWSSVSLPVWVTDLSTDAPTAGGVDPQTDTDYINGLSRELQLHGRMIVTLPDYELAAIEVPGIGRAYAVTDSARNITVYLQDPDGNAVPSDIKDQLSAIYATERLVNVTVTLADPTYVEIDIAYSVMLYPGYDPIATQGTIETQLATVLSPSGWGAQAYGLHPVDWVNQPVVRINQLIALVGGTYGVNYVESLTINGAAADYTMPGVMPLPTLGTVTPTIDLPT